MPTIPCTIDYGRLVEAINATNFAILNAIGSVPGGPQQIGLILACQQLHVVHVEATASALGIVADAAVVKK